jgi:hypothetical protein
MGMPYIKGALVHIKGVTPLVSMIFCCSNCGIFALIVGMAMFENKKALQWSI